MYTTIQITNSSLPFYSITLETPDRTVNIQAQEFNSNPLTINSKQVIAYASDKALNQHIFVVFKWHLSQ